MAPRSERLQMYGAPSEEPAIGWPVVERQLIEAGTYWLAIEAPGHPHPRPVWGVWHDESLFLSIGTPRIRRLGAPGTKATVHLDSSLDVVIVEGTVGSPTDAEHLVADYDAKYDWNYDVAEYGPLTEIDPTRVLAWRSAGFAGRDGFKEAGRFAFD